MPDEPYAALSEVYDWITPDALATPPESSTYAPDAERYLVTARRPG